MERTKVRFLKQKKLINIYIRDLIFGMGKCNKVFIQPDNI